MRRCPVVRIADALNASSATRMWINGSLIARYGGSGACTSATSSSLKLVVRDEAIVDGAVAADAEMAHLAGADRAERRQAPHLPSAADGLPQLRVANSERLVEHAVGERQDAGATSGDQGFDIAAARRRAQHHALAANASRRQRRTGEHDAVRRAV